MSEEIFMRKKAFASIKDDNLRSLVDSLRLACIKLAKLTIKGPDEEHPEDFLNELAKAGEEKKKFDEGRTYQGGR